MLEKIMALTEQLSLFFNINFILVIPVFFIVALVSRALRIRERYPREKSWILGLLCLLVSFLVSFIYNDSNSFFEISQYSVMLGSISAFTYQLFKPLFMASVRFVLKRFETKTGEEVEVDEKDMLF